MDLQLRAPLQQGVAVVAVTGEVDLSTAAQLERFVLASIPAQRVPPPGLVLDLSGVEFFGAAGIAVLLSAQERIEQVGGWLRLLDVPPIVTRILVVTDLQDRLLQVSLTEIPPPVVQ
jgi:anti-sigma B factor antagonist